jgi:hypothetical protein
VGLGGPAKPLVAFDVCGSAMTGERDEQAVQRESGPGESIRDVHIYVSLNGRLG